MAHETMNPHVEYRPIPGLPAESVLLGKDGNLWIKREGLNCRWIRARPYVRGNRLHVRVVRNKRKVSFALGPLVLDVFGKPADHKRFHCHFKNGNYHDCSFSNLEWRKWALGWSNLGRKYPERAGQRRNAKLNEEKVRLIFELNSQGQVSKDIAEMLGVCRATVSHVIAGRSWSHLKPTQPLRRGNANQPKGSSNVMSKLDEFDVVNMRKLYRLGWKIRRIARKYRICESTARHVIYGETWGHVPDPCVPNPPELVRPHNVKLSEDAVLMIRTYRREGVSVAAIANQFGVSAHAIYGVLNGRRWSHVLDEQPSPDSK